MLEVLSKMFMMMLTDDDIYKIEASQAQTETDIRQIESERAITDIEIQLAEKSA